MLATEKMIREWHEAVRPEMIGVGPQISPVAATLLMAVTFWSSGHHHIAHDIKGDVKFESDEHYSDLAKLLRELADSLDPACVNDLGTRHS